MQKLTFTTALDNQGTPYSYSVDGMLMQDGKSFPVGFETASFNRAFNELIYWIYTIESDKTNKPVDITFKTI